MHCFLDRLPEHFQISYTRCEEFLRSRDHIDLDVPAAQLWEHQWEQFLTEYYSLTQGGARIQVSINT